MRCPGCPADPADDCPGEGAARVCELAATRPGYADAVRSHAAGFRLPSPEESERIIATAEAAMAAAPKGGGCCG